MGTKGILLSVVAVSLFAFQKTYEHLGGDISSESAPYRQAEIAAILNGADPTDILAPTAAGDSEESDKPDCRFGVIIGEYQAQDFDKAFYVSYQDGVDSYIQVSPLLPTYLKQDPEQAVSASVIVPDEATKEMLNQLFKSRNNCIAADLYLHKIHNS